MDWTPIVGLLAAVFSAGGVGTLLYYNARKRKHNAEAHKTEAEADSVETSTLVGVIGVLRGEIDRLFSRVGALETRVTALEGENRGLREMVLRFRVLVQKLWTMVCENDISTDPELVVAVFEALEDSAE